MQNIFLRNSCKHPVIVLTGIKYSHMKSLVEFIYNGEVNIYQDNLSELLRIANILKIKGLDEMPPHSATQSSCDDDHDDMEDDYSKSNQLTIEQPFIQQIKVENLPSTSDEATFEAAVLKPAKKRKSVSFSDTPEIVCDKQRSIDEHHGDSVSGSGKRKLRSLSDICSITKIEKQPKQAHVQQRNDDNSLEQENKNQQLVVTINPHTIYSSNESINMDSQMTDSGSVSPKKPPQHQHHHQQQQGSSSISRKMIRTNENFLRALEAVRDEGIGFCKAAKLHGVNNRTLWLEYQKRGYPMKNARKKSQ